MAHTCNPRSLGGWGRGITLSQEFKTSLVNMVKPHVYWKYKKISWTWWQALVIPATLEAEAGESLEPRRWRLQWIKIIYCTPAWWTRARLSLKKNNKKYQPGVVAHACNPSTLEAKVSSSLEIRRSRPAWTTWWNPISTKNTKISQVWWPMPIIPAR